MSEVGARRRRALATVALAVLIVAVPLGIYAWGHTSGTFRVRHIGVSGVRPAHAKAVRVVLRRRFLGTNLFTVTAARVRAALAGFPYVAQVAVDRDFPDTLKVRLTEYVPAALLLSAGHWYVVSTEGRVLAAATAAAPAGSSAASPTASSSPAAGTAPGTSPSPAATQSPAAGASGASRPPAGQSSPAASPLPSSTSLPQPAATVALPRGTRHLPVIVTRAALAVGGTVADAFVRDALTVLAALPGSLRRSALGASATATSIRVYLSAGPALEFGDTGALPAKVLALKAVLARYRARHVTCTFVDVSVPDRPLGAPLLPAPAVQAGTPSSSTTSTPRSTATSTPQNVPSGTPTSKP